VISKDSKDEYPKRVIDFQVDSVLKCE